MMFFDLETIPRRSLSDKLIAYRMRSLELKEFKPGNLKDPEKLIAKKEAVERENEHIKRDFRLRDSVDVDYAEIIAGGVLTTENKGKIFSMFTPNSNGDKLDEKGIVERVIYELADYSGAIGGFNINNFDIPLLQRACMRHGIEIPYNTFSKQRVFDIMDEMRGVTRRVDVKKAEEYALIFGFGVDFNFTGGDKIYQKFLDGDGAWINRHLRQDLFICQYLYKVFQKANLLRETIEHYDRHSAGQ